MKDRTAAELAAERRRARSEEQLRANLKRRKDQLRARRAADAGPAGAAEEDGEPPNRDDETDGSD